MKKKKNQQESQNLIIILLIFLYKPTFILMKQQNNFAFPLLQNNTKKTNPLLVLKWEIQEKYTVLRSTE